MLQDVRFASRMLVKDPWFTFVAVLALSLGIGVNATVFTFVNAVLIRGLPFTHPEEILYLGTRNITDGNDGGVSYPDLRDWRAQVHTFRGLAAFRPGTLNVSDSGHPPERTAGAFVTANTFSLIGQQPLIGRDFLPGDEGTEAPPVAVLGYGVWKSRYGSDPAILGRTIKINEVACTVIGVMPEGMKFPVNADMWRPLVPDQDDEKRDERNLGVFGRLAPGASRASAQAEMSAIAARLRQQYPDTNKNLDAAVMTFNERFNGGPIRVVFLALLGAVGFVLLIACANVANLLLSRSTGRAREIAVRVALGAGRLRVVRQLLVESVMLAFVGGTLGLAWSFIGIRLFDSAVSNVGKPYWIRFTLDPLVFGYLAAVCVATAVLFGLAPALQVSKTNVTEILKEGGRGTAGGRRARRLASAMVIAELALTVVLLTGAGLMVRSFLKLYSLDLGFDTRQVLLARLTLAEQKYRTPEQQRQFYERLLPRLQAVPGMQSAALTSSVPLGGSEQRELTIEGHPVAPGTRPPRVSTVFVSPTYFDVLGVTIRRGRSLGDADGMPGAEAAVVNERFAARFFAGEDPIGRRVRLGRPGPNAAIAVWTTIVGIAPNIRQRMPQDVEPEAVAYVSYRQQPGLFANIIARGQLDPASLGTAVREAVQSVDPDQPVFDVRSLDDRLAESRWPFRVFGSMFAIFAIIALVLSAVGIYAVTAYSVTQRTHEIGVRMALGARGGEVTWLVLRQGLVQLAFGLTLGVAAAYEVTRVLQAIVVQIPTRDPVTFGAVSALLAAIAIAACLVPARRATRLNPLAALRIE